jgi:hypothetical protein
LTLTEHGEIVRTRVAPSRQQLQAAKGCSMSDHQAVLEVFTDYV